MYFGWWCESIFYSPHLFGIGASRATTQFASSTAVLDDMYIWYPVCSLCMEDILGQPIDIHVYGVFVRGYDNTIT